MKNLIVANWKLNPISQKEAKTLLDKTKRGIKNIKNADVVVCPPFVWLAVAPKRGKGGFIMGAQNCFWEEKGAFTGEISALMLADLKINYVIIGHSERRKYFNETDEQINKKIKKSLSAKLKPILCVGETAEERDSNKRAEVLERQITEDLKGVKKEEMKNIVIAYEPVWAIGTGVTASPEQAKEMHDYIRSLIAERYGKDIADKTIILYGGSCNSKNAKEIFAQEGVDGGLIGGASLIPEEFLAICKAAK